MSKIRGIAMNARRTAILTAISLVFSIPFVFAGPLDVLEGPMKVITSIFDNTNVVYGFTVIFFFMLLYGIYAGALKFVPAFKSDSGLSRQGQVIGISLSGLSVLAIFYFTRPKSPQEILATVLDPFGVFAGLALAALFAGIAYFGIRGGDSNSRSLSLTAAAAGFGMVIAGMITTKDNIMSWGFLIMLIAMIFGLVFRNWGRGGGESSGGGDGGSGGNNAGGGTDPDGSPSGSGKGSKDGLNWDHPGRLIVRVTDVDNVGIPSVTVKIKSYDNFINKTLHKGETNNNGIYPKSEQGHWIGEGQVRIIAEKTKWHTVTWFNRKKHIQKEKKFFVKGGVLNTCEIQLDYKSEEHFHGEPKILDVRQDSSNPNNTQLIGTIE